MKKFNFNNKHLFVVISLVLVFSILVCCFVFIPASADAGNSFGMPDRYSRDELANNGLVYKDSSYYIYCPIMSNGKKYERVNMNSPGANAYGLWTIDNWGLGQYNSTTQYYTYSKRIFFADTTRYYTPDYDFAKNFFVIPKGSSVRLSFVLHLTGQVQYYRDIYELCGLHLYTNQKYTASDKYISYDTGLRTQNYYYGNNTQVFNGTNNSEWVIQTTFTAMDEDVYVNSLHLDMNAMLWDPSVLPLADSGKMFETFLIIEYLDPEKDPIMKEKMDKLTTKIENFTMGTFKLIGDVTTAVTQKTVDVINGVGDVMKDTVIPGFNVSVSEVVNGVGRTTEAIIDGAKDTVDAIAQVGKDIIASVTGIPKWLVGVGTSVSDSISCFIAIVNGTHSLGG